MSNENDFNVKSNTEYPLLFAAVVYAGSIVIRIINAINALVNFLIIINLLKL